MSDLFSGALNKKINEDKDAPSILAMLNERQRQAASHVNGPILIVAGAGSGKTRVLTYRIAYLLGEIGIAPNNVLALTFTNKAAREMKERIKALIGDKANKLWMGTFHSVFSKILRFEANHIGYDSSFSIYDSDDSESVIKQILKELHHDPKEIKPKIIRNKISDAKNQLIRPNDYYGLVSRSHLDKITAQVYELYEERLRQNNAMDFDDLLVKPIELFNKHPEILDIYQDRFKYILIDEYQDTNRAQYTVTKLLAGKYRNICVVGDDAQSIYSFRGADIANILNFQKDYDDSTQVPLEQNYRCTANILQCAESVIKRNTEQLDKSLWTENERGEPIMLLENYDERDEANRVATYIRDLKMRKGYKENDFAILYRTNFQSRVFEEALRRHGIAYQLVGGLSFYQRAEIKDVLAYLSLLVNPNDETHLLRIINTPPRGIGNKSINDVTRHARLERTHIWDVICNRLNEVNIYKPAEKRMGQFVELILKLTDELEEGRSISEVVKELLEETGYIKHLVQDGSQQSLNKRDNVVELQNAIAYYERQTRNPKLSSFLQEVSLITDTDKYDEDKPMVTMMTIHASKGLEFPCVFLVGLEENLFPMGARAGEEANIEEERRLMYVAITRAQQQLFFSHCRSRVKFGEEQRCVRSRFLDEVDPGVVVTETGATIKQVKGRFDGLGTNVPKNQESTSGTHIQYDWKKPLNSKQNNTSSGYQIQYDDGYGGDPFVVGSLVMHPKFGPGKIINRTGLGNDTKVVVFFKNHGQKKLMLRFAKLQPLQQ